MDYKLKGVASFTHQEMMEMETIILDEDEKAAFQFLKDKVLERVNNMKQEHSNHEKAMAQVKSKNKNE